MAKHTHTGECQHCGRRQAARVGLELIAKHGYTKDFGFFNGTCVGSDQPAYEHGCEVVKASVRWADARIATLTAEVETLREPVADAANRAMYHEYVPASWTNRRSGYVWRDATFTLENVNNGFGDIFYTFPGCTAPRMVKYTGYYRSTGEFVTACNATRADALEREIAWLRTYRGQQQNRVDAWTLRELTPVAK